MKVLVTGSSGWLGRHLVPLVKEAGHNPVGFDVAPGPFTDVIGSVADRSIVRAIFEKHGIDGVIHAGALHKPDIARYPQQTFIDVNVTGTLNLLEVAARKPGTPFVFTSTTSLMISQKIRDEQSHDAVWLDEDAGPLEPRNIYGVTKLAAEGLCRQHHLERRLSTIVLRTARFFPEEDDTIRDLTGPNLKANELLHRRASVRDVARAHLTALERAGDVGFRLYIVSAPTPFARTDAILLKHGATSLILRKFPNADELYAKAGWRLPRSISRVYDGSRIGSELGFEYETRFADILSALHEGKDPPVDHDADYVSPAWLQRHNDKGHYRYDLRCPTGFLREENCQRW